MGENMIPVICQTKHNPPESYGDCVRACVASILELNPDQVPNFFATDNELQAHAMLREWLNDNHRMIPAFFLLKPTDNEDAIYYVLKYMNDNYHDIYYILFCNSGGDHAVVGFNNEIVHNPAWVRSPIKGPHSSGYWIVYILAKL